TVAEAYALEKRVQGWSRAKREALIRGEYHLLPGLSRRGSTGGDNRAAGRRPGGEDAPAGRVLGGATPRRSSAGRSPGYRDRGVSIRRFAATQPTGEERHGYSTHGWGERARLPSTSRRLVECRAEPAVSRTPRPHGGSRAQCQPGWITVESRGLQAAM